MHTQCNAEQLQFSCVERRRVVAAFDGGTVSSDAGALLLGRADAAIGLIDRLASCFTDGRATGAIEHTVRTLVGQRVFGMALGYEDLNDREQLCHDPACTSIRPCTDHPPAGRRVMLAAPDPSPAPPPPRRRNSCANVGAPTRAAAQASCEQRSSTPHHHSPAPGRRRTVQFPRPRVCPATEKAH